MSSHLNNPNTKLFTNYFAAMSVYDISEVIGLSIPGADSSGDVSTRLLFSAGNDIGDVVVSSYVFGFEASAGETSG